MIATSLFSLALLLLAGVMLDANRQAKSKQHTASDDHARRFLGSQYRRRRVANLAIVAVGVLFALWPATPREPFWVASFAGCVSLLALAILTLGVCDAWSSGRYYREVSRRRLAEHTERLRDLLAEQRGSEAEGAPL